MTKPHLTLASLLTLGVLACSAAPALAKKVHVVGPSFGAAGSGPGQFSEPQGVAVNDGSPLVEPVAGGDVYVLDEGNDRVERFSSAGAYLGQFNGSGAYEDVEETVTMKTGTAAPTGAFSFAKAPEGEGAINGIAVDDCVEVLGERCSQAEDPSVGDVYVTDTGHHVIDKFSPTGVYLGQLTGTCENTGETPPGCSGFAPFNQLDGVAVDLAGELWVYHSNPEAIFAGLGDHTFHKQFANYSDTLTNEFIGNRENSENVVAPGFAVGPEDDLYAEVTYFNPSSRKLEPPLVTRLDSAGEQLSTLGDPEGGKEPATAGAAVNLSTNEIYIDNVTSVRAFDASEDRTPVERFGSEHLSAGTGVAVNSSTGNALSNRVYVADGVADRVDFFPYADVPGVTTEPASNSEVTQEAGHGVVSAKLNGRIEPGGLPLTTCTFEYGTSTSYGDEAPCEPAAASIPDTGETAVAAKLTNLLPGTTYHFRLRAANRNDESEPSLGSDETFTTPGPGIAEASAVNVASTSAELNATLDPNKAPTSYHFEYDTRPYAQGEAPHGTSAPVPNASIGSGEAPVPVSEPIQGLIPNTVYHYRVVASSEVEPGKIVDFDGSEASFTTQAPGQEFTLPDGRSWELVSPPDKHGANIENLDIVTGVVQAAAGGGAITYKTSAPTESGPQGNLSGGVQVLSTRGPGGWSSRDITPPHASGTGKNVGGKGEEYRFFSENLGEAVVQPFGPFLACVSAQGAAQPCLSPDASAQTPFLHSLQTGTYTPLLTGCPSPREEAEGHVCPAAVAEHTDVPPGTVFTDEALEIEAAGKPTTEYGPIFRGATPDLSHIVLGPPAVLPNGGVPLTETTPVATDGGLYEYSDGHLALVSVLPDGIPVTPTYEEALALGELIPDEHARSARHAISADGSRVVFSTYNDDEADARVHLYLRVNAIAPQSPIDGEGKCSVPADACTVQLDSGLSGSARFQMANQEATQVFFTDGGDLYEYQVEQGGLKRLTEGAEVQASVLGASEDASYLYFVAKGKLVEGASPGQPNLYLLHDGATRLVAVLSGEDIHDWGAQPLGGLAGMPARVAPGGEWLAFMSQRSLTGYDNLDASSSRPDQEVYLYHASTGALSCASCDPTGARPTGAEFGSTETLIGSSPVEGSYTWVAGSVPGWLDNEHEGSAIYQPRYLSNDGRLFFDSPDALVPLDVDGTQDVYEYEPENVPSGSPYACSPSSASGSEVFKDAHIFEVEGQKGEEGAGCVALISSGTSSKESIFLGASANGGDVFFMTAAKLVSQDYDTSYDVYDAHECTSESPCSTAPVPPPECDTEASCKASPTPQPSIYGLPSSATFSGPGNLAPAVAPPPKKTIAKKPVKCKRGFVEKKVKKKELCVKVKSKKLAKKSAHTNRRIK